MSMKHPVHPGRVVREECLEPNQLSVMAAAEKLGVTRQTLNNLVSEKSALSPEMALRLEKVGWSSADAWLRLQMNFDLANVRARAKTIIVPGARK
jgi:addiction module HigA family antidote